MNLQTITPEALSNKFIEIIRSWISAEEAEQLKKLTAEQTDSSICHSHDFCDANEAMIQALAFFGHEILLGDDEDANPAEAKIQNELIDTAWNLAKANNFSLLWTQS